MLLVDGRGVGPVEIAARRAERRRGLLGRVGIDGALLLPATRSVHTVGMSFPIEVALCSADLEVLAVARLVPGRLTRPRRRVRHVLEAEPGTFHRWGIAPGVRLGVALSSSG